jgi:hypothetical protein
MCLTLGLERFITVDVEHRTKCFGAVIKHVEGWSVVSVSLSDSFTLFSSFHAASLATQCLQNYLSERAKVRHY